jgi:hypothetical protein
VARVRLRRLKRRVEVADVVELAVRAGSESAYCTTCILNSRLWRPCRRIAFLRGGIAAPILSHLIVKADIGRS